MTTFSRLFIAALLAVSTLPAQWGGELRFCFPTEPRNLNPALVDDDASETVRYLTGGVLVRVNRINQKLEPELATSWKIENAGKTIVFKLRQGLFFSDGTPFSAADVAYTMRTILDPDLHSPTGDSFRIGTGTMQAVERGTYEIALVFPETIAGLDRLFDQVAIMSQNSPLRERAVLGPFQISQHKPGSFLVLARNPHYWKTEGGRRLPYLDRIRLDIQQNRELELIRFRRGEIHLIRSLDPDRFQQLASEAPSSVKDAGATLDGEVMWFNMKPGAPIPAYRKNWFRSRNFRLAISRAIRRDDISRVVYHGHAQAAAGPFSAANLFWFNQNLKPLAFDPAEARRLLAADGFRLDGRTLRDREGHPVEFSVITNAGNRSRERVAAMIQQDLQALGIRLNIATLDFPSLMERISKSFQYESCLLGLTNVDLDPSQQMNVWLSSSSNHQWNPSQTSPETVWEAEIDRLMRLQASAPSARRRKALFDQVQQLVSDQAPFLYLINKNALVAFSSSLKNVTPSVLRPQVLWNVEKLWIDGAGNKGNRRAD